MIIYSRQLKIPKLFFNFFILTRFLSKKEMNIKLAVSLTKNGLYHKITGSLLGMTVKRVTVIGDGMDWFWSFVDVLQNIDQRLDLFIQFYGVWSYLILFLIIFCETGLVIAPFLPGDSLLLVTGALAASGPLDLQTLLLLLIAAAVLGSTLNYGIGYLIGPKIFHYEKSRFFNHENLIKTNRFYKKYGAVTILISMFIPVIRTFAPFVAGIGRMSFGKFMLFNILGGAAWITVFLLIGFFFGRIPIVRDNSVFMMIVILLITVILLPFIIRSVRKIIHNDPGDK